MEIKNDEVEQVIKMAIDTVGEHYEKGKWNHTVASVILGDSGRLYKGVNIHSNHGYCAEIIALGAALTAGERGFRILASASSEGKVVPPCGSCRQILYEYAGDCCVVVACEDGEISMRTAKELLPDPYVRPNLINQAVRFLRK